MILFLLFFIVPVMEIAAFVTIGGQIGLFWTLFLCLITALIGSGLLRHQGLQVVGSIRNSFSKGLVPTDELFDGFCLVGAGAFLLTPGFVTDTVGFLLFTPPFRRFLQKTLKNHTNMQTHMHFSSDSSREERHDSNIIEGDYQRLDDEIDKKP